MSSGVISLCYQRAENWQTIALSHSAGSAAKSEMCDRCGDPLVPRIKSHDKNRQ
jgi:hypothetical protein